MSDHSFTEGVRLGGLTTNKEVRILLCYLVDNVNGSVRRQDLEEVLLSEGIANYFLLAECLTQLSEQDLLQEDEQGFLHITSSGKTVARTLHGDLPRSIRNAAVHGIIRAQHYAAKEAAHACEIITQNDGYRVQGSIGDTMGSFFELALYMPDKRTASAVREKFVEKGDEIYKLVLAALTNHRELAEEALQDLLSAEPPEQLPK